MTGRRDGRASVRRAFPTRDHGTGGCESRGHPCRAGPPCAVRNGDRSVLLAFVELTIQKDSGFRIQEQDQEKEKTRPGNHLKKSIQGKPFSTSLTVATTVHSVPFCVFCAFLRLISEVFPVTLCSLYPETL